MEIRVEFLVEKVVYHPVAHACLVDIARFRVGNIERRIVTMNISFVFEIIVETGDIGRELRLKFYDIFFVFFAAEKPLPCYEEIFD